MLAVDFRLKLILIEVAKIETPYKVFLFYRRFYNRETIPFIDISPLAESPFTLS